MSREVLKKAAKVFQSNNWTLFFTLSKQQMRQRWITNDIHNKKTIYHFFYV